MKAIKDQIITNLISLKKEIESYKDDVSMWEIKGSIKNAPATLAIHLCGNLKHNIGAGIGKNGFIRDRDSEFSARGLRKKEVISEIDLTLEMIEPVLDKLTTADLESAWPNDSFGDGQTVASVLLRIGIHLGYHIGQINYHRRLLAK